MIVTFASVVSLADTLMGIDEVCMADDGLGVGAAKAMTGGSVSTVNRMAGEEPVFLAPSEHRTAQSWAFAIRFVTLNLVIVPLAALEFVRMTAPSSVRVQLKNADTESVATMLMFTDVEPATELLAGLIGDIMGGLASTVKTLA